MKCVLDTNVVLDWLVFDDPRLNPLRDAVRDGLVTIVSHAAAVEELRRVLDYPELRLDSGRQEAVLQAYLASVQLAPVESETLPKGFPRCRDPDDQHFLALAFHSRADALVSKDKAVLVLRRRCAKFGFAVWDLGELNAALASAAARVAEPVDE